MHVRNIWTTIELRMKHTTPNSPSNALFVAPEADQWSAPEHAIAHVLAHVRTHCKGQHIPWRVGSLELITPLLLRESSVPMRRRSFLIRRRIAILRSALRVESKRPKPAQFN